jgi:hypothetical protein
MYDRSRKDPEEQGLNALPFPNGSVVFQGDVVVLFGVLSDNAERKRERERGGGRFVCPYIGQT